MKGIRIVKKNKKTYNQLTKEKIASKNESSLSSSTPLSISVTVGSQGSSAFEGSIKKEREKNI